MLRKLAIRNAKKQSKDYSLYFVTLVCTVSFMYAFNDLIFSESVKNLPSQGILPYMIVTASLLIVFVVGWIISYMTNYILKKRSREFSIYLLSGIPNRAIITLVFYENMIIGGLAFLVGVITGILFSQLLEVVLFHMFGVVYTLRFHFSLSTTALTFSYFFVMLLYSLWRNGKWLHKVSLYSLLYSDRQNEKGLLSSNTLTIGVFFLSLILGGIGGFLIYTQPFGKGYDVLIGTIFLVFFLFGFFLSVPSFLVLQFGDDAEWKYKKNRLVMFRGFTAKINSMSIVMGILSVLFMLSMTFIGIGATVNIIADRNVELSVFDIMILHNGEVKDFSSFNDMIHNKFNIQSSHSYSIYTNAKTDFLKIRNKTMKDMGFHYPSFVEFQHDTYMKQSDYAQLRKILGYEYVTLDPCLCYIHCVPALEKNFGRLIEQGDKVKLAGYPFATRGIFTEAFSQMDAYGNGLDYVIVVPDETVNQMKVLYSLYAATTKEPLSGIELQEISDTYDGIEKLQRNVMRSVSGSKAATALIGDVDYLSGKWADKENLSQLYAMSICLFYLALILEITGAAILATQVLSDREKKRKQDCILWQLGMNEQRIVGLNNRQLFLMFMLPMVPSLIVSSCFIYISAKKIQMIAFHFPVFSDDLWIVKSLGITLIFFVLLYSIYYAAARISYQQRR